MDYAEEYIKIAVFQIHNRELLTKLNEKLSQGVRVELFTLPYNSIHDGVREEVVSNLRGLGREGADLFFCKWNAGDPERTTTAVNVWYSFHGKFIVSVLKRIDCEKYIIDIAKYAVQLKEKFGERLVSEKHVLMEQFYIISARESTI